MIDCLDVPPAEVRRKEDPIVPIRGRATRSPFRRELSGECGGEPRTCFDASELLYIRVAVWDIVRGS